MEWVTPEQITRAREVDVLNYVLTCEHGMVAVFEAPVDCLSHQTLCNQGYIEPFDGWRLSLGGTALAALKKLP